MSELSSYLALFHFIRPLWLLLVPLVLLVWWLARRVHRPSNALQKGVAPHLAKALTVGDDEARGPRPVDGVMLGALLLAIGAAGPTWSQLPNPLVANTASLVLAVEVTESMTDPDVPPNRLERAKQKIADLGALRGSARTGLLAYAGTAHRVTPLTEDPEVLRPFVEGLSPDIMPRPGENVTAALEQARVMLADESAPGAILFLLDGLAAADVPAVEATLSEDGAPQVLFLAMVPAEEIGQIESQTSAPVIGVSIDTTDVAELDRRITAAYRAALAGDDQIEWVDRGWILAWPVALLTLLWFRRGWTMRWSVIAATAFVLSPSTSARAEGVADWFLTPDQQGYIGYKRKNFSDSAALFSDPVWQGYMLYRSGQYDAAIEVFQRMDSAEAAFSTGMAMIKSRQYRPAVDAFELALERRPDYPEAQHNLEVAQQIVIYVEETRAASDTGEESGIGADEVVYDNESDQGAETTTDFSEDIAPETAEQWMRTVDTNTRDFLRQRFLADVAGGSQ